MKPLLLFCLVFMIARSSFAQATYLDSLHLQVNNAKEDTAKVASLYRLALYYGFNQIDINLQPHFLCPANHRPFKKIRLRLGQFPGTAQLIFRI